MCRCKDVMMAPASSKSKGKKMQIEKRVFPRLLLHRSIKKYSDIHALLLRPVSFLCCVVLM